MESRQVALMNLFAGQQWRYRERLVDTVGEGEGGTNEERRKENIHYRMQNRQPVGTGCMTWGGQTQCSVTT